MPRPTTSASDGLGIRKPAGAHTQCDPPPALRPGRACLRRTLASPALPGLDVASISSAMAFAQLWPRPHRSARFVIDSCQPPINFCHRN
jgi:hypothetical protein